MDSSDSEPSRTQASWLRKVKIYILHILVAVIGVFLVGALLELLLERFTSLSVAGAICEGPVFFGEIGLGFLFGFGLNRNLRSKSAMWTWVLPAIWLAAAIPGTLNTAWGGGGWGFLFGTKCRPDCFDQLITVCPFYSSVAYSVGAWASLGVH